LFDREIVDADDLDAVLDEVFSHPTR